MSKKEKLLKSSSALAGGEDKGSYQNIKRRYLNGRLLLDNIVNSAPVDKPHLEKAIADMKDCWTWWHLRHYPQFEGLPSKNKVTKAISCKRYRLCPICALRRSQKVWHSIQSKISALGLGLGDLFLVTITIKNTEDLKSGLDTIRGFYSSLVEGRKNSTRRKFRVETSPWAVVDGWIGHLEITKSDKGWHPHYHFLVAPKSEYKYLFETEKVPHEFGDKEGFYMSKFASMLGTKLNDYCGSFMVDCKPVKDSGDGSIGGSIAEVSKYLFKFSEMSPENIWYAYEETRGMRLSTSGGVFRSVELEPKELTDELDSADEMRPWVDYLIRRFDTNKYWSDEMLDVHKTDLLPKNVQDGIETIGGLHARREWYTKKMRLTNPDIICCDLYHYDGSVTSTCSAETIEVFAEYIVDAHNDDCPFYGKEIKSYFQNEFKSVKLIEFYDGLILRRSKKTHRFFLPSRFGRDCRYDEWTFKDWSEYEYDAEKAEREWYYGIEE